MSINIAIDGPAGAGKSSIAKAASAKLGYIYVDTGALYRSIALYAMNKNLDNENLIVKLTDIKLKLEFIEGSQHVILCGEDVSEKIRTPEVSMEASRISAIPEVRSFLLDLQKKIARENNIIMDGRDIGTVILPNADLKIFLTASPEERAERRYKELKQAGNNTVTYEGILEDIKQRDYNDMHRETAPLKKADDAVILDTTGMTVEESVDRLLDMVKNLGE